jgi:WD40 repeat protein
MASGQEIQRTAETPLRIISVAFAPDGRTLAYGGAPCLELHYYNRDFGSGPRTFGEADFSIRLWDLVENKEIRRLAAHARQVESLAFSPDGTSLVSGSSDNTPLYWDVASITDRFRPRGGRSIGTRKDKQILENLAQGATGVRQTEEAKAAATPRSEEQL